MSSLKGVNRGGRIYCGRQDLPGIHYQIGLLYRMYENTPSGDSRSIQEFDSELKINPYDAWSEYRLGRVHLKGQETDDAITHLRRAVRLDGTLVPARLVLARALEGRGDVGGARDQLEAASKIDPRNATVHYRLANIYKKGGNLAGSAEEMQRFEAIQAGKQGGQEDLHKAIRRAIEPEDEESPDPHD